MKRRKIAEEGYIVLSYVVLTIGYVGNTTGFAGNRTAKRRIMFLHFLIASCMLLTQ